MRLNHEVFEAKPRQTEMGILVGPNWNDDRPETTVLLELRMEDVTRLDERGLDMGQIRGSIEAVDRLEFAQVRSHAEREPESLNDRPSRLEVHAGALRIKTQRGIGGHILLESGSSCLLEIDATCRHGFQIRHGDRDIRTMLLEPLHLIDDHRMPQMHATRGHETRQDAVWFTSLLGFEDGVQIPLSEDDAPAMQPMGFLNRPRGMRSSEASDDGLIVRGGRTAPWIDAVLHAITTFRALHAPPMKPSHPWRAPSVILRR